MPHVREILERKGNKVFTASPGQTVMEAVRLMSLQRIGAVVLVEAGKVIGIFSERDLVNRVVAARLSAEKTLLQTVMSAPVTCCSLETALEECRETMTKKKIRHLPVVEGDRLLGLVSIGDLMAWEIAAQQSTIENLQDYLYGRR